MDHEKKGKFLPDRCALFEPLQHVAIPAKMGARIGSTACGPRASARHTPRDFGKG
ncbi:hypothetical protein Y88_1239 [Novosphingobium nitrogenifigens DSM 19370]|uniref:Uncharacterized protein n=1 Tax=Novosphingobium nitrogenifigens DSM 19370 TaxID=983920 RepID=F1Z848_9SPHN|nr:hypothetical protein Y88_1239 [Novosphingobium nitrogenifigens DSM 19370]